MVWLLWGCVNVSKCQSLVAITSSLLEFSPYFRYSLQVQLIQLRNLQFVPVRTLNFFYDYETYEAKLMGGHFFKQFPWKLYIGDCLDSKVGSELRGKCPDLQSKILVNFVPAGNYTAGAYERFEKGDNSTEECARHCCSSLVDCNYAFLVGPTCFTVSQRHLFPAGFECFD